MEFEIHHEVLSRALKDNRDDFVLLHLGSDPLPRSRSPRGISRGNLFRWWYLRGVKGLPGIPSALPILFLGPTLRFQEMKIDR